MAALRLRYCAPEFAFFTKVMEGSGGGGQRVDGMAMNMWSSRGYAVSGFEVKVSRADWLRELKSPAKAESIFGYCDHWYLVAPREAYKIEEIPEPWGVIDVLTSTKDAFGNVVPVSLRERKKAPKLNSKTADRGLLAMMLRRGNQRIEDEIETRVQKQTEDLRANIDSAIAKGVEERRQSAAEDQQKFKKLCELVGDEHGWVPPEDLAAAIKAVRTAGIAGTWRGLADLESELQSMLGRVAKARAGFAPGGKKE